MLSILQAITEKSFGFTGEMSWKILQNYEFYIVVVQLVM